MSVFLIHQEPSYLVLLADSLGQKQHSATESAYSLTAPKLVHVAEGVYAAHAGTLQPAVDMLSELGTKLTAEDSWETFTSHLQEIGQRVYAKYQERFKNDSLDVRVAIVVTGDRRYPKDIEDDYSSSIILWEAARHFKPHYVRGHLHFAGSTHLSELSTSFLSHAVLTGMLKQGPLAAAHALVATHAALAKLSSSISPDANVVIIGEDDEHTVLHGNLLDIGQAALIKS